MKSEDELRKLFAEGRLQRQALLDELQTLGVNARRERLLREPLLVRSLCIRWRAPQRGGSWSAVGSNKSEQNALDQEIKRIDGAASRAAMRCYKYEGSAPLATKEPWRESVGDLMAELAGVPLAIVTFEFERALRALR